ncbi:MAG TPA: hypothetical protein VEU72_04870 [Nitrosopumilaceae archaeon]|nr:hypothetical protein [Nitrosopumilaceae archaeon]
MESSKVLIIIGVIIIGFGFLTANMYLKNMDLSSQNSSLKNNVSVFEKNNTDLSMQLSSLKNNVLVFEKNNTDLSMQLSSLKEQLTYGTQYIANIDNNAQNPCAGNKNERSKICDILPNQNDTGTAWKIIPTSPVKEIKSELVNSTGFENGIVQSYIKNVIGFNFTVTVSVLQFNSETDATESYTEAISKLKENGGFTEFDTSKIAAKCFGKYAYQHPYDANTYYGPVDFYCVKSNILYHVNAVKGYFNTQELNDVYNFAKVFGTKL